MKKFGVIYFEYSTNVYDKMYHRHQHDKAVITLFHKRKDAERLINTTMKYRMHRTNKNVGIYIELLNRNKLLELPEIQEFLKQDNHYSYIASNNTIILNI